MKCSWSLNSIDITAKNNEKETIFVKKTNRNAENFDINEFTLFLWVKIANFTITESRKISWMQQHSGAVEREKTQIDGQDLGWKKVETEAKHIMFTEWSKCKIVIIFFFFNEILLLPVVITFLFGRNKEKNEK